MIRYRFARDGRIVLDRRRLESYFGTDEYRSGMPIFAVRKSSQARDQFKAQRAELRRAAKKVRA